MADRTYIYGLVDPRDSRVKYIGKSNNPMLRLKNGHLLDKNKSPKTSWIKANKTYKGYKWKYKTQI